MQNLHFIPDDYGFWDLAGRNLFFRYPKFILIDIKNESKLATDYFLIEDQNNGMFPEKALLEALKTTNKKIYIRIKDNTQSKVNLIVNLLPSYFLHYGRYVAGNAKTCPTVVLLDEIMIGVENPELQKNVLLKKLKSERSLSKFSSVRPIETLDYP